MTEPFAVTNKKDGLLDRENQPGGCEYAMRDRGLGSFVMDEPTSHRVLRGPPPPFVSFSVICRRRVLALLAAGLTLRHSQPSRRVPLSLARSRSWMEVVISPVPGMID